MRQAMKIMKEQAAAMAVQAQQQAQEAAVQKSEAEASLASANTDLAEERSKFANLQVKPGQVASTLSRDEDGFSVGFQRPPMLSRGASCSEP